MKKRIISTFIFLITISVYAVEKQALTTDSVNSSWNDIYNWKEGRSSVLIESGYDKSYYEQKNIWDGDIATAWVEGINGNGINEWVIIEVDGNYQNLDYDDNILNKKLSLSLKINNGFCKNEKTFYNNNRVKKAKITIYEVPLRTGQHKTYALEEPCIMYETEIILEDTMNQQNFSFTCSPKAPFLEGHLYLYVQLTILDVYPGEKYQDTCISEMSATAEVIEEETKEKKKSLFKRK